MKQKIVISAVNIFEAGPLSILKDCLSTLEDKFLDKFEIIALVQSRGHFNHQNIQFIEFPKARDSYFRKFYYEYYYFKKLSKKNKVFYLDIAKQYLSKRLQRKKVSILSRYFYFF